MRRLRLRCGRSIWSTSVSFCLAGAASRAPPERSTEVWQRLKTVDAGCVRGRLQHLEHLIMPFFTWHLSLILEVAGAARGAPSERSTEVRGQLSTVDAGCVCVAGAAFGAPRSHFAVAGAALGAPPFHFTWQAQRLEHLMLRGRCSTGSISVAYGGCGACSYFHDFPWSRLLHVS